ncbi:MAG: hypothetical protein Q8N88_04715 [Nanoarchaeota archaeon]|nr:hypothetical protein [Nanoarchaeota archaeon]
MNKTKTWFGTFVILIVAIAVFAPISVKPWIEGKEISIRGFVIFKGPEPMLDFKNFTTYKNPEHNSCYIFIPNRSIIVRVDDARSFSEPTKILINKLLGENVSVTIGVIPRQLESDKGFVSFIRLIKNDPRVEIAQHGVFHDETDKNLTEEALLYGLNKIQSILYVRPITYSTPFNDDLSPELEQIISKYFKGITGEWGVLKEGRIAELGHTVSNYPISQNDQKNISGIIDICRQSLNRTNYCVVLLHPQEFATDMNNPVNISSQKLQELDNLILELKKLDANFITFKDIIACSESNSSAYYNANIISKQPIYLNYS